MTDLPLTHQAHHGDQNTVQYQGAQIGEGKKSMAFNLVFVAEDRTLNVEEVDNIIKKILKSLSYQLGAELR